MDEAIDGSRGVLFVTYSMLVSKGNKTQTRFKQILKWLTGSDSETINPSFEGVIVFDEGHLAKNIRVGHSSSKGSQTGLMVAKLQQILPNARIVYVSATGATEPKHMGYMSRLGLWDVNSNRGFAEFSSKIDNAGIAAMEMIAMEMKSMGMYCNRFLSFEGASFDVVKITLDSEQREMFNKAAKFWQSFIHEYLRGINSGYIPVGDKTGKLALSMLWANHQRFFLQLMVALKVKECVRLAREAISDSKCVVIGLFNTGESALDDQLSKSTNHDSLLSSPLEGMLTVIEKWFPTMKDGQAHPYYVKKQAEFIAKLKEINLPINPIDDLIDQLGGINEVAEMTGRTKRLIRRRRNLDRFDVETRRPKQDNSRECANFMNRKKRVAIISEAASVGISLQASVVCRNKSRRVHIILQLPWAADKAIQQLGRTHRSHQVSAPEYKLLITELGGEWRLASVVAQRLCSLGALTNGDRTAGSTGSQTLSNFFISKKYATKAIDNVYRVLKAIDDRYSLNNEAIPVLSYTTVSNNLHSNSGGSLNVSTNPLNNNNTNNVGSNIPLTVINNISQLNEVKKIWINELEKTMTDRTKEEIEEQRKKIREALELFEYGLELSIFEVTNKNERVKRFLNRLLGLSIERQQYLFDCFMENYDLTVLAAQQEGSFDDGIFDMKGILTQKKLVFQNPTNQAQETYRYDISILRGMPWEEALALLHEANELREKRERNLNSSDNYPKNGFYVHSRSFHILLATQRPSNSAAFHIVKPHLGHQPNSLDYNTLRTSFKLLSEKEAEKKWSAKFEMEEDSTGVGGGREMKTIVSGSILPVFDLLLSKLERREYIDGKDVLVSRLQIIRAEVESEIDFVGEGDINKMIFEKAQLIEKERKEEERKKKIADEKKKKREEREKEREKKRQEKELVRQEAREKRLAEKREAQRQEREKKLAEKKNNKKNTKKTKKVVKKKKKEEVKKKDERNRRSTRNSRRIISSDEEEEEEEDEVMEIEKIEEDDDEISDIYYSSEAEGEAGEEEEEEEEEEEGEEEEEEEDEEESEEEEEEEESEEEESEEDEEEEDKKNQKKKKVVGILIPQSQLSLVIESFEEYQIKVNQKVKFDELVNKMKEITKLRFSRSQIETNETFNKYINQGTISTEDVDKEIQSCCDRMKSLDNKLSEIYSRVAAEVLRSFDEEHYISYILHPSLSFDETLQKIQYKASMHHVILSYFYLYLSRYGDTPTSKLKDLYNYYNTTSFDTFFAGGIDRFIRLYTNYFSLVPSNNTWVIRWNGGPLPLHPSLLSQANPLSAYLEHCSTVIATSQRISNITSSANSVKFTNYTPNNSAPTLSYSSMNGNPLSRSGNNLILPNNNLVNNFTNNMRQYTSNFKATPVDTNAINHLVKNYAGVNLSSLLNRGRMQSTQTASPPPNVVATTPPPSTTQSPPVITTVQNILPKPSPPPKQN